MQRFHFTATISLVTNLRKRDNNLVTKIKRRITLLTVWEGWEENEMAQNFIISDTTQESECEINLPVKRTCKENTAKQVFKSISKVPFQTFKNGMIGKSQDKLGELI